MPVYNAPLTVADLLGIQVFHPGLTHTAQVVDAVDEPPLWAGRLPMVRSLLHRDLRLRGDVRILLHFGTIFSSDG